jgi:hypothetical protein
MTSRQHEGPMPVWVIRPMPRSRRRWAPVHDRQRSGASAASHSHRPPSRDRRAPQPHVGGGACTRAASQRSISRTGEHIVRDSPNQEHLNLFGTTRRSTRRPQDQHQRNHPTPPPETVSQNRQVDPATARIAHNARRDEFATDDDAASASRDLHHPHIGTCHSPPASGAYDLGRRRVATAG